MCQSFQLPKAAFRVRVATARIYKYLILLINCSHRAGYSTIQWKRLLNVPVCRPWYHCHVSCLTKNLVACGLVSTLGLASCSFDTSVRASDEEPSGVVDASFAQPDGSAVSNPDAAGPGGSIVPDPESTGSGDVGGNGGSPFGPVSCPEGELLIGVEGDFYQGDDDGAGFCNVRARCSQVRLGQSGRIEHVGDVTSRPEGNAIGFCGGPTTAIAPVECGADQVVTGLSARMSGQYGAVTELQLRCATIDSNGQVQNENFTESWGFIVNNVTGNESTSCPEQTVATALEGRVGAVIDALGLRCSRVAISD